MKYFEWVHIKKQEESEHGISLMEVSADGGRLFWASLDKKGDFYVPVTMTRTRNGYLTITEPLSIVDAKLAVEKKLMDDGVIEDGDVLKDYTE